MDLIIECSSVYAIDFAAVVFCIIEQRENINNYHLYLNECADVQPEYRKYISRLALPTFSWERDSQGVLRQIHIPVEQLDKASFLDEIRGIISSLTPNEAWSIGFIQSVKTRLDLLASNNPVDFYIGFIESLIKEATGKELKVMKFGDCRYNILGLERANFLRKLLSYVECLSDGKYQFVKGGHIIIHTDGMISEIRCIEKTDNATVFTDINNKPFTYEELISSDRFVLRGSLETLYLCTKGSLLDLPWYLDARLSDQNSGHDGIEYISPISSSGKSRISYELGGKGDKLFPAGYSLLDYECDSVLKVITQLYPLSGSKPIVWRDLNDWKQLIYNYPLCNQKISKSQAVVKKYCNSLLEKKISNRDYDFQFRHNNFVLIGYTLSNLACAVRIVREYIHSKSIYYRDHKHIDCLLPYTRGGLLKWLYENLEISINEATQFAEYYHTKRDINDELLALLSNQTQILCADVEIINNDEIYRLLSKLEIGFRKVMVQYYEIVSFLCGAILKANLFTAFCVMQEEYPLMVESILEKRDIKCLYFTPIVLAGVNHDA